MMVGGLLACCGMEWAGCENSVWQGGEGGGKAMTPCPLVMADVMAIV